MTTVSEFMGWTSKDVVSTGVPELDVTLKGGLPIGVTLVSGSHSHIADLRESMKAVQDDRYCYSIPDVPPRAKALVDAVQDLALLYGRGAYPTIVDTGNLTGKFEGQTVNAGALFQALRQVGLKTKAAVLVELNLSDHERGPVMREVGLAARVDRDGVWTVLKARSNVEVPFQFSSQAWGKRAPATPQRVRAALLKNPALAWEVSRGLKLLGPWTAAPTGWHRLAPDGGIGCQIGTTTGSDVQLWFRDDGCETDCVVGSAMGLGQENLTRADEILREHGFTLLDEVPPW